MPPLPRLTLSPTSPLTTSAGTGLGILLSSALGSAWTSLAPICATLSCVHITCNYLSLRHVCLNTLNAEVMLFMHACVKGYRSVRGHAHNPTSTIHHLSPTISAWSSSLPSTTPPGASPSPSRSRPRSASCAPPSTTPSPPPPSPAACPSCAWGGRSRT